MGSTISCWRIWAMNFLFCSKFRSQTSKKSPLHFWLKHCDGCAKGKFTLPEGMMGSLGRSRFLKGKNVLAFRENKKSFSRTTATGASFSTHCVVAPVLSRTDIPSTPRGVPLKNERVCGPAVHL